MSKFTPYKSGRAFLEPTPETFDGLEEWIRWAETEVPSQLRKKMNELVFHMALLNQGIARKMSFGPYDPQMTGIHKQMTGRRFIGSSSGELHRESTYKTTMTAWKIPVRRITGRYYLGWKVRQLRPAVWMLYNDSREAFYIEYGIHTSTRRVRRPIRKLSLKKTMDLMTTTKAWHRIWVDIYANPQYPHRGMGFHQTVSGAGAAVTGNQRGALVTFTSPMVFGQSKRVGM